MKPVIFGIAGATLSSDEAEFFRRVEPAGYILFKRNCVDPAQMRALTDALRDLHGREDVLIMIDQEGGRVARMQPPVWPAFPAGGAFDPLYDRAPVSAIEAARANAHALALMLRDVGVNVDAAPMLDVRMDGASDIVGDRALGSDPMQVAALGRAMLDGLRKGGVVGIVKHMPGHGRALVDSHHHLPVVDASAQELERDIAPFRTLRNAPMGMTSHIVYTAWDAQQPASRSPIVIDRIIRGEIGFDGLLMSDDLDMKALSGAVPDRAAAVVAAGCDLALNCWARMDEMQGIVAALPDIGDKARERLDRAMATVAGFQPGDDMAALLAKRDALLALA